MRLSTRTYAGLFFLLVALIVLAVVGTRAGTFGDGSTWPPDFAVNRIAVVGYDAKVRLYDPDGSNEHQITRGQGIFTWPTWSPDARSIVYSGVVEQSPGVPVVTLFSYDRRRDESTAVHMGKPGFAGLLAAGVVHYPLWSPDSSKLSFVVVTEAHGLTLYLSDRISGGQPSFILDNGPLWTSWSSDSSQLAIHRGGEHFVVTMDDPLILHTMWLEPSISYRVPAWRPGRDEFTMAEPVGPDAFAMFTVPVFPPLGQIAFQPKAVTGQSSAFLWSPSGSHIAVGDDARPFPFGRNPVLVYRQLRVLDGSTFEETVKIDDNVVAYFWSPDGARIAYVTLTSPRGLLTWSVLDVASGETTELIDFLPSPDQLTMFQFFDQYAYSHQLWSPDSRNVVFAGIPADRPASAAFQTQQRSQVYVLDTGPSRNADPVAPGVLGFWSPM